MKMKVRARAPLRLGFAGGGTDLSPFCDEHTGYVMNAAVALYAYAHISPSENNDLIFEALELGQRFEHPLQPSVPIADNALLHRGVYNRIVAQFCNGSPLPVHVRTAVDVPAGSGMGGSSTLVVAMIEAYRQYLSLPLGEYDVANLAIEIEREDLGLAGGRQDQYAAAFGGFNFMEFYGANRVIVNPLRIRRDTITELEASIVLYYVGKSRDSAIIIRDQQSKLGPAGSKTLDAMMQLKKEAVEMKEALLLGDVSRAGEVLNRGWQAKKATSKAVTTPEIDRILSIAMAHGAYSGKVSGAGGGGFIMLLVSPESRVAVINELEKQPGKILPCVFTTEGAQSWKVGH